MNAVPASPLGLIAAGVAAAAVGSLFAAGDAALAALPEARLAVLADGDTGGRVFGRYARDRTRVASRWLVGRTAMIALAAVLFSEAAEQISSAQADLAPVFAVLGAVCSYGLFAELLITVARRRPDVIGGLGLRFLWPLEWVVVPLAEPLAILARFISRRYVKRQQPDARTMETEVEWVVSQGEKHGALANEPAEMIRNVLEFKDLTAKEVMVARRRIVGIDVATTLEKALSIVTTEGHSRFPIYRENLDNIVGLLYAKDLFAVMNENRLSATTLANLVRSPVLFVVETQPILSMLREMRARRLHMAIVSDEFGGTSGVITLEDIIEEIVGEIEDEHDTHKEAQIQEMGDGRLVADAAVPLADLSARLGREFPDGDFESLGGLLVHRAGRVPEVGTTLMLDGLKFIVREADATHIVTVEIVPVGTIPPLAASPS